MEFVRFIEFGPASLSRTHGERSDGVVRVAMPTAAASEEEAAEADGGVPGFIVESLRKVRSRLRASAERVPTHLGARRRRTPRSLSRRGRYLQEVCLVETFPRLPSGLS